jgi:very-short-patch-repair endonuclease
MFLMTRVIPRNMFYSASKNTFEKARLLRNNMTEAEKILWDKLKDRKIFKTRFRRQHPVSIFIVDFYCHEFKLAIEIDGGIHLKKEIAEYDEGRTCDLEKFGIKILRFGNDEVLNNSDLVLQKISQTISSLNPL